MGTLTGLIKEQQQKYGGIIGPQGTVGKKPADTENTIVQEKTATPGNPDAENRHTENKDTKPQDPKIQSDYSEVLARTGYKTIEELYDAVEKSKNPANVWEMLNRELGGKYPFKGKEELVRILEKPTVIDNELAMYYYNASVAGIPENVAYMLKNKKSSMTAKDLIHFYSQATINGWDDSDTESMLEEFQYSNEEGKEKGNHNFKKKLQEAKEWMSAMESKLSSADYKKQFADKRDNETRMREHITGTFNSIAPELEKSILSTGIQYGSVEKPMELQVPWNDNMKRFVRESLVEMGRGLSAADMSGVSPGILKDLAVNAREIIHKELLYRFLPDIIDDIRRSAKLEEDKKTDNPRGGAPKDAPTVSKEEEKKRKKDDAERQALSRIGIKI